MVFELSQKSNLKIYANQFIASKNIPLPFVILGQMNIKLQKAEYFKIERDLRWNK